MSSLYTLVLGCLLTMLHADVINEPEHTSRCGGQTGDVQRLFEQPVRIFLTVSPKLKPQPRLLQINWEYHGNETAVLGDSVALMLGDYLSNTSTLLQLSPVYSGQVASTGRLITRHWYGHTGRQPVSDQCSPYWAVYRRSGVTLASGCLRTYANWMWLNRENLMNSTLPELMIPGTHDSGAYETLDQGLGFFGDKLVVTQDESVWNQLVYGIRYLDLRIGFRELRPQNPFWIYHGVVAVRPFYEALQDIKLFLEQTKEIVILDFHRLTVGFNKSIHDNFIELVTSELSPWILPKSAGFPTLAQMWSNNQRLVIGYAHRPTVEKHHTIWSNVEHAWGNVQNKTDLFDYLSCAMLRRRAGQLWSAMAELTPTIWHLIGVQPGLRHLAHSVNNDVTAWSQRHWWHLANIIATDFFLANDIVAVAIESNRRRHANRLNGTYENLLDGHLAEHD